MKAVVTMKRLRGAAAAQQAEVASLRAALTRLRRRTFPAFVDVAAAASPDAPRGGGAAGRL